MLIKLFGLADVASAISLVLLSWGFRGWVVSFAIVSAIYLSVKGVVFFFDFASLLDLFSAVMIVLVIAGFESVIVYIFVLWLLQKGVRSLL